MLYDLLADFYEKSSDRHPKYIVLMGTYNENTFDEMKILGFQEDSDSNASFQDYVMDGADENFLKEYTKDGYQSEMLDVLYSDVNYEKIQVRALADEALDDEGRHAPRGVVMGDMFVHFTESDPMTPVWFVKLNPESPLDTIPVFQIPMRTVKRRLKVITLIDAMFKLLKMNEEKHWTEELLREFFAAGIDEALEIITYEFRGQKDIDGNPAILHPLTVGLMGVNDNEKTVGFLHDLIEDCDWSIEDLHTEGFLDEVVEAVDVLTHRKDEDSYDEYVNKIILSGNRLAINVKLNDLHHNLQRGKVSYEAAVASNDAAKIKELGRINAKHEKALEMIKMQIMNNDFAKSILDNPYSRVEDGQKIDLFNVLEKYSYQRQNIQLSNLDAYAEDLGVTEVELLAYQNWINDGTPTGIESDEQFYDLQRQAYGEVVIELS